MTRINLRSAALSLALLLAASAAFAGENPRAGKQDPAGRRNAKSLNELTLVVDPNGPGKPGSEVMHYVATRESIENDVLYGFTTLEGRDQYIASRERRAGENGSGLGQAVEGICTDARFNKVAYGTGTDWLTMYCGQTNPYLSDSWNDVISYAEASGSWTILYKCYYFSSSCDILWVASGNTVSDLNVYGMNNVVSSIRFCSNVDPFSCTQ